MKKILLVLLLSITLVLSGCENENEVTNCHYGIGDNVYYFSNVNSFTMKRDATWIIETSQGQKVEGNADIICTTYEE